LGPLTPEKVAWGLTYYVVLLFSLSVHESAHGWVALRMGDDTAARQGRVSLNPLVHIDPIGTLLIPLLQVFFTGIPLLGWAKPTPVGAHNFRRLARGHVLVAGAGPISNLLLATLFTIGLFVALRAGAGADDPATKLLDAGIRINVVLALFNLIPLPPLDGSWMASWGLPRRIAEGYDRVMEPYGQWILLILFATGMLGRAMQPFSSALYTYLSRLAL
jgi:Zn-dependent protease